ncbi:MAG: hypothetical protein JNM95_04250 [Chitinophagaceae bacterium]|nr:hypothetical protein [Chitinophagaceae bacterium]
MSLKYNAHTLKKLEDLFDELNYTIRFEKGNFNSGYCVLQEKKMVVINKFLTLEGRINALLDILPSVDADLDTLTPQSRQCYDLAMAAPIDR